MNYINIAVIIFTAWNLIVFFMYGIDKRNARQRKWRISEKILVFSAFFMGGAGALLGMRFFRHKTKHWEFKIGVPLLFILNIIVIVIFIYLYFN